MSAIYNLEPQPTASVILHTTSGELSVELWAKQTPLTCRNFLQLCVDGYYDDTIFHRLVPGFILQGGDPTGTGNGGESIYDGGAYGGELDPWPMDMRRGKNAGPLGVGFKDEFHSRLKFNRRGLLGMANESKPDTNGSQFFLTLGKAEELNGKNTLFGRVAGDTIYNLAKMGEAEVEAETDRPSYPVKILRVEVVINPFDDIKKRTKTAPQPHKTVVVERRKKRKGGKTLLSFGGDEDEEEAVQVSKKPKFDTRVAAPDDDEPLPGAKKHKKPKSDEARKRKEAVVPPPTSTDAATENGTPERSELRELQGADRRQAHDEESEYETEEPETRKKSKLEKTNDEIAALKASMRRTVHAEPVQEKPKTALERMIPETSTRGRKKNRSGKISATPAEERDTIDFLKSFQSRLNHAPEEKARAPQPGGSDDAEQTKGAGNDEEEEELCDLHLIADCQSCRSWDKQEKQEESDDEGWMSHALSFQAERLGKDLTTRRKAEEELLVIDPRERERTLKEEKKAEREARAGNSGRQWDQARNAQMARQSALAGRGAK